MTGFSPWLAANLPHLIAWTAAICTLGLYSVLYRENKIYRLFEHIFLGLATGFLIAQTWTKVLLPNWWVPMWDKGQWWLIFTLIVGLFYYFIFSKKYNWLARLVIGFFLGVTAGRAFQAFANDTWPQIASSFKPVIPHSAIPAANGMTAVPALSVADAINNVIFMMILLCVVSYFFFSFEQKHPVLKGSARLGRWMLMFTFGAIFGSTVMARLALLIDRMDFLLNDFGPFIGGPAVAFTLLACLTLLVLFLSWRRRKLHPEAEETP
jgi:hypothetical protein